MIDFITNKSYRNIEIELYKDKIEESEHIVKRFWQAKLGLFITRQKVDLKKNYTKVVREGKSYFYIYRYKLCEDLAVFKA